MIDKDTLLLEETYDQILLENEFTNSVKIVVDTAKNIPEAVKLVPDIFKWVGKAAIGGVAGATITWGLGKALEAVANKMDLKRQRQSDLEQGAVGGVSDKEFEKQMGQHQAQTGEEMSLEQQVQIRIEIAKKLQEMYPVKDKSFWVKVLEGVSKMLQSKFGLAAGGILGVIATKLLIPIPTL